MRDNTRIITLFGGDAKEGKLVTHIVGDDHNVRNITYAYFVPAVSRDPSRAAVFGWPALAILTLAGL